MPRPVAQLLGVRDFYPGHFPARFYPIAFQTACLFQTFDRPECLLITAPKAHKIRILATSDVHMHLMPHDYFADEVRAGTGLEASAAHITALRREAQQNGASCLLFDNGDLLQGNPLADQIARMDWNNTDIHPVAALMNALEYDALGVGNHDLDYGVTYLARFRLACSNVARCMLELCLFFQSGQRFGATQSSMVRPSFIVCFPA